MRLLCLVAIFVFTAKSLAQLTPELQKLRDALDLMSDEARAAGVACVASYKDDGKSPAPDFIKEKLIAAFKKRDVDFKMAVVEAELPGYAFTCFTPIIQEPMSFMYLATKIDEFSETRKNHD